MRLIKVHISCHQDDDIPEALRDEIETKKEWRTAYLNIDNINYFYPDSAGWTLIDFGEGADLVIKEDLETVHKLIKDTK